MKNTTQNIINVLENEHFSKLYELKEKVSWYWWWESILQEMTFNEAYTILEEQINLLKPIDLNNVVDIDNFLSFTERTWIFNTLNQLNSYIINLKAGHNNTSQFIQLVQSLQDIINKSWLNFKVKWYPNYQEKLKQINYLKNRYEEILRKLEKWEELRLKIEDILTKVSDTEISINKTSDKVDAYSEKLVSLESDIDKRYEDIKVLNKNIVEYDSDTKNTKNSIAEFFTDIDKYKKDISDTTTLIWNNIKLNNDKTNKIIEENENLQIKIKDILWASVWTNLYKSFNEKSKWMLAQSVLWLIILGLSIWFLVDSWTYIFENLKTFFENWKLTDIKLTFYLRLTLIFPSLYAVYFASSEFKTTNKLKEEYDFKSAVAVWLHYFKELVEDSKDSEDKKFLIDAIKQIFSSPTEKVFWKKINDKDINNKAKDLVSDIAGITSDITNKILPK